MRQPPPLLLLLLPALLAAAQAQYGPDPPDTPPAFQCGWRQLAYNRSVTLRPDAAAAVRAALAAPAHCAGAAAAPPPPPPTPMLPPRAAVSSSSSSSSSSSTTTTIWVDGARGDDANPGTDARKPKRTLQAAVDAHVETAAKKVVVRAGTYFVGGAPVTLAPATASNLEISAADDEEVWLSGGVPLARPRWTHVSGRVWSADLSSYSLPDVAALRVDGARLNKARYPNADPEREFWPTGYTTSKESFVAQGGDWLAPTISPGPPNPAVAVNVTGRPWDAYFTNYTGGINGTCSIYTPPFSFWCSSPPFSTGCGGCFTWNIPSGLETRGFLTARPGWPYSRPTDAEVFAWRKAHWANWQFKVQAIDAKTGTVRFGLGGFQGARGGPGSDWFVQNIREELDAPNEFYFDRATQTLYVYANETDARAPPSPARSFVAIPAAHHTLMTTAPALGRESESGPGDAAAAAADRSDMIVNLTLSGLGFRDTAPTMLQPHGVPSGGDWALERMGAVFLEGTAGLTVQACGWWRIGGNALMLSRRHTDATVEGNSFAWLGGSAVALWGWTDELRDGGVHGVDGTGGFFPRRTTIAGNLFREIGVWEKQSSAVFQAKSAETTIRDNVVFNLARAGVNFNDGFGGGDVVEGNVLFNTCRESSDHGPINSWDRQPFVTNVRDGATPSAKMAWRHVTGNLVVANYGGSKEVDNDDGSLFWRITGNVMVFGWGQKFKCGAIESFDNLKLFIELGGKFDAGCVLGAGFSRPNLWHNDSMVVLATRGVFAYRQCWNVTGNEHDFDRTQVYDNTVYVANEGVQVKIAPCPGQKGGYTLADIQREKGADPGSTRVVGIPPVATLLAQANAILQK